jgi:hypothetical protein
MRILSLVFSFLVTVSVTALALSYVPDYVGQQRIYVQAASDSTPDPKPYRAYGDTGVADPDSSATASAELDPYHQRYYSESEGWTYFSLPSDSSSRTISSPEQPHPR